MIYQMKRIFKTIAIALAAAFIVSGCSLVDFSEDCTYYGDVKIRYDWSGLLKGDTKPGEMQTVFYATGNSVAGYSYTLKGDTVLTGIQEGQYNVLSYNPAEGLTFSDQAAITASLPIYRENNKSYTIQAPVLYAAKSNVYIQAFETSLLKFYLESCIQQIGIDFVIIKDNLETEVISLSGELDGVSTGYNLSGMLPVDSYAALPFKSIRQKENNFNTNLKVFGLSANTTAYPITGNILGLSLLLSDGTVFNQALDLTETFKSFSSPAIHLTIEIRLSAIGMVVTLTDWYFVNQGEVEI